ncbi:hypothetical protein IOD16_16610 [Saccharothrix sp. 6-C]|uniref:Uncharacterized protein n=1 Tax=Saccharothrix texasensis TaxID=103734 RepID=A0A3N1GZ29_9PSEU|nr:MULTISPECIES: hypothetical protein [Saccharothrix]QQQ79869.1 hypothetical protein IOD16_16610 [Saccharothrix sp. 6-C]ROP35439.1 hypothetical protein EDD40_0668 [Saccharothrix texasensis]
MPKGFYTDDRGRVRPVAGRGGRSRSALLAGLIALSAVGYGGAVGLSTGGSGGGGGPGLGVEARKQESGDLARRGDADGAWRRMGLHGLKRTEKQQVACVDAAFGGVREFLRENGCASMERVLFTVGDDAGNSAVIAVAWVEFASRGAAQEFQDIVDAPGTGDVTALGVAQVGLADVAFTGANYGSGRDRTTVAVAEAEVATGYVTPEVLDALAEVAAQLPR